MVQESVSPGKRKLPGQAKRAKRRKNNTDCGTDNSASAHFFDWGTERIRKGLFSLPPFMQKVLPDCAKGVDLSRTSVKATLDAIMIERPSSDPGSEEEKTKYVHG